MKTQFLILLNVLLALLASQSTYATTYSVNSCNIKPQNLAGAPIYHIDKNLDLGSALRVAAIAVHGYATCAEVEENDTGNRILINVYSKILNGPDAGKFLQEVTIIQKN